jgi:hypothetical protein
MENRDLAALKKTEKGRERANKDCITKGTVKTKTWASIS